MINLVNKRRPTIDGIGGYRIISCFSPDEQKTWTYLIRG